MILVPWIDCTKKRGKESTCQFYLFGEISPKWEYFYCKSMFASQFVCCPNSLLPGLAGSSIVYWITAWLIDKHSWQVSMLLCVQTIIQHLFFSSIVVCMTLFIKHECIYLPGFCLYDKPFVLLSEVYHPPPQPLNQQYHACICCGLPDGIWICTR